LLRNGKTINSQTGKTPMQHILQTDDTKPDVSMR